MPEGKCGLWRIERLRVDATVQGPTTALPGAMLQSRDHDEWYARRNGREHDICAGCSRPVPRPGAGPKIVIGACLDKPEVEHVTVVELEADVIALVAPH